ncbi:MAG TPA: hypothetical protein VIP11_23215 [Gemmatimonadaceae bacterium]
MKNQNRGLRLATDASLFADGMLDASRQIGRSMQTGNQGKQQIWDLGRNRNLLGVQRICDVSVTCTSAADSLAFPDALRSYILARRRDDGIPTLSALRAENEADLDEDAALFEYMQAKTSANRARAIEALRHQEMSSRALADALMREQGVARPIALVRS